MLLYCAIDLMMFNFECYPFGEHKKGTRAQGTRDTFKKRHFILVASLLGLSAGQPNTVKKRPNAVKKRALRQKWGESSQTKIKNETQKVKQTKTHRRETSPPDSAIGGQLSPGRDIRQKTVRK